MLTEKEAEYGALDVEAGPDETKGIRQEQWDRKIKLKAVNFKSKGYHRVPLISLAKILIVVSLYAVVIILTGVAYFVIAVLSLLLLIALLIGLVRKIQSGERIFELSGKKKKKSNKKLRQKVIEAIDKLMRKQI